MSIRGSGRRVCLAWTLAVSGAASLGGLPAEALDPLKALTQYPIESWGYREGLPQGEIQSILQSRDGYLWLGTNGGAVRFDGVRFEVFDRSTSHLADNEILSVREARDGSLWFATAGGISRLEGGVFRAAGREAGRTPRRWACSGGMRRRAR